MLGKTEKGAAVAHPRGRRLAMVSGLVLLVLVVAFLVIFSIRSIREQRARTPRADAVPTTPALAILTPAHRLSAAATVQESVD